MIFGTLLGASCRWLLEAVAAHFGAPNEFFKLENYASNDFFPTFVWFQISIVALAAGMSAAAFSCLDVGQKFSAGIGPCHRNRHGLRRGRFIHRTYLGRTGFIFANHTVPLSLRILIAIPTMAVLYLWLALPAISAVFKKAGVSGGAMFLASLVRCCLYS